MARSGATWRGRGGGARRAGPADRWSAGRPAGPEIRRNPSSIVPPGHRRGRWCSARSLEIRGGRRKPDSVEVLVGRFRVRPGPRMIIYLGRRLPDASSDLPGSRDGSGRSVSGGRSGRHGKPHRLVGPFRSAPLFGLAPDGVYRARPVTRPAGELLPHRFTLTAAGAPKRPGRGGLFSVALSLSGPLGADPDGGRYPPSHPVESGLSSAACPRTEAFRPVGFPPGPGASAQAPRRSSRPPRTLTSSYGPGFARTTRSR